MRHLLLEESHWPLIIVSQDVKQFDILTYLYMLLKDNDIFVKWIIYCLTIFLCVGLVPNKKRS